MKSQFETRTSCTDDAGEITVLKCESIPKGEGKTADKLIGQRDQSMKS